MVPTMKKFICFALITLLSACGTTSSLRNAKSPATRTDLSSYNYVIVNDFKDGVSKSQDDPAIISEGKKFADIIAKDIKAKNEFAKVERNINSTDNAILIDGKITQHSEGNTAARMLLGFGAGSSHFDAAVYIKDNKTKNTLGNIDVDKTSWALGGAIAASQDVNSHMNDASAKIANELVLAKKE